MRLGRRALLAGLLAGCAGPESAGADVEIAPGVPFRLPAPQAFGTTLEAAQWVGAAIPGQPRLAFTNQVAVSPARLLLVGLDPLGRRAMTLRWDGERLAIERADWLPAEIRPANVVADLMLLYAAGDAIRAGLPSEVELGEQAMTRSLHRGGAEVVAIAYQDAGARRWQGRARLRNMAYGYDLDVRSTVLG